MIHSYIHFIMEDDFKFVCKWKTISICLQMTGTFWKEGWVSWLAVASLAWSELGTAQPQLVKRILSLHFRHWSCDLKGSYNISRILSVDLWHWLYDFLGICEISLKTGRQWDLSPSKSLSLSQNRPNPPSILLYPKTLPQPPSDTAVPTNHSPDLIGFNLT